MWKYWGEILWAAFKNLPSLYSHTWETWGFAFLSIALPATAHWVRTRYRDGGWRAIVTPPAGKRLRDAGASIGVGIVAMFFIAFIYNVAKSAYEKDVEQRKVTASSVSAVDAARFTEFASDGNACSATLDASRAPSEVRRKYDAALVCGFLDVKTDRFKDIRITVSQLYNLGSDFIPIHVPMSKYMRDGLSREIYDAVAAMNIPPGWAAKAHYNLWYKIILLPRGTNPSVVQRLEDVPKHGGQILQEDRGTRMTTTYSFVK